MIRYLNMIILLMWSLLTISCSKDWFDEKSNRNLAVPETLQDFEYLMDNFSVMTNVSPGLGEIASDGHYIPENTWQSSSTGQSDVRVQKNGYTWTNTFLYEAVRDWNLNYAKVFQCNIVLNGLDRMPSVNSSDRLKFDQIKGDALFHRAKCYFDLAQIYAQPYIEESASSDLGIPMKEGVDVTANSVRSSVKEVYDKVLSDLKEAGELLPDFALYPTRGSKLACFGLLARVYLTMGNYQQAGFYADAVLKVNNKLLDFNVIPATNANLGLFNSEVIFHSRIVNFPFVFSPDYIYVDQGWYDLYVENDLRKTRFFTKGTTGIVFKGMYNNNTIPFTGIATDEMYLIRAECSARLNNIPGAMKDLNDLLRTRWAKNPNGTTKYVDQTASTELAALNIILLERRKELLLRGLRWVDLRRLNRDERFRITLTRTIGGKTYTLEPNSYKYTFPIPDDEISFSGLQQNPGWTR